MSENKYKNMLHGKKIERLEIRLDSFDKIYLTALSNKRGCSIGFLIRDILRSYREEMRKNMTDEEYKELLNYMLILSQSN